MFILLCTLNLSQCFASGNYEKFRKSFPKYYDDQMPITSSAVSMVECICGYSTETIYQKGSQKYKIFALSSVDFNTKNPLFEKRAQTYTYGSTLETQFSSAVQWFSVIDSTFRSYSFQQAAVQATLTGFLTVYEKAGKNEGDVTKGDVSCAKEILFLDDMSKFMFFNAEKSYEAVLGKQNYPGEVVLGKDLSKVTKTRKEKFLPYQILSEGKPLEAIYSLPATRWNFVTCKMSVTFGEDVVFDIKSKGKKKSDITMAGDVQMTFVFADGSQAANYFMIKLGEFEYKGQQGIKDFINDIEKKPEEIIGIEQFNNIKLFNFDVFVSKETMDLIEEENPENTKEILLKEMAWPNKFQFDLCAKLLNNQNLGNPFGLSEAGEGITDMGKNIWNYWKDKCPILAWTGTIIYENPIFEGEERQVMHGMINGMPEILSQLTEAPEEDKAILKEIKTGKADMGCYKTNNYATAGGDIEFTTDVTFEEFTIKIDDKIKEKTAAEKEEFDNKPKEDSPESENPDVEEELIESNKAIEEENNVDEENNDETQGIPDESNQSREEHVADNTPSDFELECEANMKVLESLLEQAKEPKNCKHALHYAILMMYYPRGEKECINIHEFTPAGNVIMVGNNTFLSGRCRMLCLFEGQEVSVDHALIKKPKPDEEPIKCHKLSFELIFENKTFENPKTMMLYVPQMDAYNEWDKYTRIFQEFIQYYNDNNGEMLNLRILKKKFMNEMNIKIKGVNEVSGWIMSEGPTGPDYNDTQGLTIDKIMDESSLEYIFHPLRMSLHNIFYDIIYESWYVGDYIMIRIQGSQLDYTAMLHQFAHADKVKAFMDSIFEIFRNLYLSQNIISMMELKKFTYTEFKNVAKNLGYVIVEKKPELEGQEDDPSISAFEVHQEIIQNVYPTFNFLFYETNLEIIISVYGFIHGTENLPTLNLFFKTELFEAEYLVPLSSSSEFNAFLIGIYTECLKHMISLLLNVRSVENPNLSDDDLKALQAKGRYNFPKMMMNVRSLLEKYIVYGCVSKMENNMTDKEGEEIDRKFKWKPDVDSYDNWDSTGRFTVRRSNQRLHFEPKMNMCVVGEALNPVIVDVYPTLLDGNRKGYAVTLAGNINGKRMSITYYIVAYQDYPHMKTFDYTLNNQLSKFYNSAPPAAEDAVEQRKLVNNDAQPETTDKQESVDKQESADKQNSKPLE